MDPRGRIGPASLTINPARVNGAETEMLIDGRNQATAAVAIRGDSSQVDAGALVEQEAIALTLSHFFGFELADVGPAAITGAFLGLRRVEAANHFQQTGAAR